MRSLRVILALSTFALVGCQVVGGFEDFSAVGGSAGGGTGGGSGASAGSGGETGGTAGSSAGSGGVGGDIAPGGSSGSGGAAGDTSGGAAGTAAGQGGSGDGSCPAEPGALGGQTILLQLQGLPCFRMMRREVNHLEYSLFAAGEIGVCATRGGMKVDCEDRCPPTKIPVGQTCPPELQCGCDTCGSDNGGCAQKPVTCLGNCAAQKFCESRGARLCTLNELKVACSGGDPSPREYPYVGSWVQDRCNDEGRPAEIVAAATQCITPQGVAHLVGNVSEWAYATQKDQDDSTCPVSGGRVTLTPGAKPVAEPSGQGLKCDESYSTKVDDKRPDLGFRCCVGGPP